MNEKGIFQLKNESGSNIDMIFHGLIDAEGPVNSAEFASYINYIISAGIKKVTCYVNSPGGDIFEGVAIITQIRRAMNAGVSFEFVIDGIAASMMAIICCIPGADCTGYSTSKMMFHEITANGNGTASDLKGAASLMEEYNADFCKMICAKTGITQTDCKATMINKQDNWFNADKCKLMGLMSKVSNTTEMPQPDVTVTDAMNLFKFYNSFHQNNLKKENMKLTAQALLLFATAGITLRPEASEQEIEMAVKTVVDANAALKVLNASLKTENDGFKALVANADKLKVTALVDAAIAEKKITEDMRVIYTNIATADFASAKAALDKMPGYKKITDQLGNGSDVIRQDDKGKTWTWDNYHKEDPIALENMKTSDFEQYKMLFKNKFGVEPKA